MTIQEFAKLAAPLGTLWLRPTVAAKGPFGSTITLGLVPREAGMSGTLLLEGITEAAAEEAGLVFQYWPARGGQCVVMTFEEVVEELLNRGDTGRLTAHLQSEVQG